jgi:CRP-like cAMP-binding protein
MPLNKKQAIIYIACPTNKGGRKMVNPDWFKNFPLFQDLDVSELKKLATCFKERHYPAGAVICPKGEAGNELFLIQKGSVAIDLPLHRYDSGFQTISVLAEGAYFGELSFFDGKERSAAVIAREAVSLLVLKKEDYDRITKSNLKEGCKIQQKIISSLIRIIRNMNETYSSSMFLR